MRYYVLVFLFLGFILATAEMHGRKPSELAQDVQEPVSQMLREAAEEMLKDNFDLVLGLRDDLFAGASALDHVF